MIVSVRSVFLAVLLVQIFYSVSEAGNAKIISNAIKSPRINFECGVKGRKSRFSRRPTDNVRTTLVLPPSSVRRFQRNRNDDGMSTHVIGGEDTFKNEFPWMVLLGRKKSKGKDHFFCDGSLINEKFVLTAAHCVLDKASYFVRIGEHDKNNPSPDAYNIKPKKTTIHPQYKLKIKHHDIALVELETEVNLKHKNAMPICLPWGKAFTSNHLVGERVTITGWGALVFGGEGHHTLQKVEVKVFNAKKCNIAYKSGFYNFYPEGLKTENTICAGTNNGKKDACGGDSGGPLAIRNKNNNRRFVLEGVIVQGDGCGKKGFPGLNVPVRNAKYLQWIKDVAFTR